MLRGQGASGAARADLPIYLGAEGPKNVAMTAEIADGWLAVFFSPKMDAFYRNALAEGFSRPGARRKAEEFEVVASVPIVIDHDIERAADSVRRSLALYMGGMGAREANFHFNLFVRMGYEEVARRVQDLFLSGRQAEAMAAIPTSLVEDVALIGPEEKIRDELPRWKSTVITTFLVSGPPARLQTLAKLLLG